MHLVITCGPSYEPIDQARRITNFSTGRLGIFLANTFVAQGHQVACFKGEQATCPDPLHAQVQQAFSTNADLAQHLQAYARTRSVDAVLHAAALCDFRVDHVLDHQGQRLDSPKFSTRSPSLQLICVPTLKVLPHLRTWFPHARIIGWKYELAGTRADAFARAATQLREAQSDACVLNGAAYGSGFALCLPDGTHHPLANATELAHALASFVATTAG